MKTRTKVLYLIASSLIVFGMILAAIGYFNGAHYSLTFTGRSLEVNNNREMKTKTIPLDAFNKVDGQINNANIAFVPSDSYKVEIKYPSKQKWSCKVENGTLYIQYKRPSKYSFGIGLTANDSAYIKVYVPNKQSLLSFKLANRYGDTRIEGISSDSMNINSHDGDLSLADLKAQTLEINNLYGDTRMKGISSDSIKLNSHDGDLSLASIKAEELVFKNEYGDSGLKHIHSNHLTGTTNDGDMNLSNINVSKASFSTKYGDTAIQKITSNGLKMKSNDGDITVKGSLKGETEIISSYGDVSLQTAANPKELSYMLSSKDGDIVVNNKAYEGNVSSTTDSQNRLQVKSHDGDIALKFSME